MKHSFKDESWDIGHYCGESSICVNFLVDGNVIHHRHDYGGITSRARRLGAAIEEIEREVQKDKHRQELMERMVDELKPIIKKAFKRIKLRKPR